MNAYKKKSLRKLNYHKDDIAGINRKVRDPCQIYSSVED